MWQAAGASHRTSSRSKAGDCAIDAIQEYGVRVPLLGKGTLTPYSPLEQLFVAHDFFIRVAHSACCLDQRGRHVGAQLFLSEPHL